MIVLGYRVSSLELQKTHCRGDALCVHKWIEVILLCNCMFTLECTLAGSAYKYSLFFLHDLSYNTIQILFLIWNMLFKKPISFFPFSSWWSCICLTGNHCLGLSKMDVVWTEWTSQGLYYRHISETVVQSFTVLHFLLKWTWLFLEICSGHKCTRIRNMISDKVTVIYPVLNYIHSAGYIM